MTLTLILVAVSCVVLVVANIINIRNMNKERRMWEDFFCDDGVTDDNVPPLYDDDGDDNVPPQG